MTVSTGVERGSSQSCGCEQHCGRAGGTSVDAGDNRRRAGGCRTMRFRETGGNSCSRSRASCCPMSTAARFKCAPFNSQPSPPLPHHTLLPSLTTSSSLCQLPPNPHPAVSPPLFSQARVMEDQKKFVSVPATSVIPLARQTAAAVAAEVEAQALQKEE